MIITGICSFGMSGKIFHAPFIEAHPKFILKGIVERSKSESSSIYPDSQVYRSVNELMGDPEIELVIVNTPTHTHYEYALQAIESGKHVVLEKPMCIHYSEAIELVSLAEKNNVKLTVYQNRRYDGDYKKVREIVSSGRLGELREVEIRYDRYRPGFSGKQHKEGALPGAGVLYDLGAHLIDQALQLFGTPLKIFADVFAMRNADAADDYFELIFFYPNLRVRLKSSCIAKGNYPAYILHGTNGTALLERSDIQEQALASGVVPSLKQWVTTGNKHGGKIDIAGEEIENIESVPGNYMDFYDQLFHCILHNGPLPVNPAESAEVIRMIELALTASQSGQKVIAQ